MPPLGILDAANQATSGSASMRSYYRKIIMVIIIRKRKKEKEKKTKTAKKSKVILIIESLKESGSIPVQA
jgi:hypothetical protein